KALFAADGDMVMAHCLKGYFMMLMAMGWLMPKAREAAAAAARLAPGATAREQAHAQAVGRWTARDLVGAARIWEEILLDHPRDVLALRLAHFAHFYSGDARALRDSVQRALPGWDEGVPAYSYVKGMEAFGFEEAG